MNNQMIPDFLGYVGGKPNLEFSWREVAGKRRLIGNPNKAMRVLHQLFGEHLTRSIRTTRESGYGVRKLPSATGCVKDSNPTINAEKHRRGKFFYITDLKNAYPSVDLERLALIIVFLSEYGEYDLRMSLKFFLEDDKKELLKEDPPISRNPSPPSVLFCRSLWQRSCRWWSPFAIPHEPVLRGLS